MFPTCVPCQVCRGRGPAAQEESQRTPPTTTTQREGRGLSWEGGAGLGVQQGWRRGGPVPGQEGRPECRLGSVASRLPGEEAEICSIRFELWESGSGGAAGGGEGQAQLISCQWPRGPFLSRLATGEEMPGNGSHSSGGGAHAEPRGALRVREVDVLRPGGALCRDQASAVRALDWDGARAGEQRSCWSPGKSPTSFQTRKQRLRQDQISGSAGASDSKPWSCFFWPGPPVSWKALHC